MTGEVVVALVGMAGCGKTTAARYLVGRGFASIRFGQIVLDEVKRRQLPPTEAHEHAIREEFRSRHGMAAMAVLNKPRIDAALARGPVVIDNLLSWSEYKALRDAYGGRFAVIAIHASPRTRYARLGDRALSPDDRSYIDRPFSPEEARHRDVTEIENIEKGGPIAMADHHVVNEGSPDELLEALNAILATLPGAPVLG